MVFVFKKRDGKSSVEAVTRAYGIDGFDFEGLDPRCFSAGDGNVGSLSAALEDYAPETFGKQVLRGIFGLRIAVQIKGASVSLGVNQATGSRFRRAAARRARDQA